MTTNPFFDQVNKKQQLASVIQAANTNPNNPDFLRGLGTEFANSAAGRFGAGAAIASALQSGAAGAAQERSANQRAFYQNLKHGIDVEALKQAGLANTASVGLEAAKISGNLNIEAEKTRGQYDVEKEKVRANTPFENLLSDYFTKNPKALGRLLGDTGDDNPDTEEVQDLMSKLTLYNSAGQQEDEDPLKFFPPSANPKKQKKKATETYPGLTGELLPLSDYDISTITSRPIRRRLGF